MNRFFGWLFVLVVVAGAGAYVVYRYYLPEIVASALVQDEAPSYMPKFVKARIEKFKAPVNEGASDVIREIHESNVPLEEVLEAIDRTDADRVVALVDELNQTRIVDTDQVFDVAKRYFYTEFDIEVFRQPFNENVDTSMIRKGLRQALYHRGHEPLDADLAKAIIKQVLIQKEEEYLRTTGVR